MPSSRHEVLVSLLRQTASTFLAEALPSSWRTLAWRDANVLLPTPDGRDRRADLVLVDVAEPPRAGLVVEVQLRWVRRKQYTLPYYQFAVRQQHECPVMVIVATPDMGVAARFGAGIEVGSGTRWHPTVVGPHEAWGYFQRHAADTLAVHDLLVVACLAGPFDDGGLAEALFQSLRRVDSALHPGYIHWALTSLSETGARVLKELIMNSKRSPHPTDYDNWLFRWMYGTGRDEGRDEGREEGREEGRAALLALAQQILPAASYAQVAEIADLNELRDQVLARVHADPNSR